MKTDESKAILKRRGAILEAVFGQIKTVRGAARFMRLLSLVKTKGHDGLCVGVETPERHAQSAETLPGPDQGQTRGRSMPGSGVQSGLRGTIPSIRPFQGERKKRSGECQTGF
ncbi:MAG: hypothetical protein ACYCTV_00455 [Leptospirales bacterium]